jgi:hypothetical protein
MDLPKELQLNSQLKYQYKLETSILDLEMVNDFQEWSSMNKENKLKNKNGTDPQLRRI